jgi:hypothetical protein
VVIFALAAGVRRVRITTRHSGRLKFWNSLCFKKTTKFPELYGGNGRKREIAVYVAFFSVKLQGTGGSSPRG